ncbi:MAG: HD domain-containing protein, partial [Armatimonadetes bacterium]|nr:HD domain-containing protein [Armatimonadota bacterium]
MRKRTGGTVKWGCRARSVSTSPRSSARGAILGRQPQPRRRSAHPAGDSHPTKEGGNRHTFGKPFQAPVGVKVYQTALDPLFGLPDAAPGRGGRSWLLEPNTAMKRMRDLPLALQRYILLTVTGLAPVIWVLSCQPLPTEQEKVALFVALIVFNVVFSTWKVELTISEGKMTLTFAVVCLALLRLGLLPAAVCAVMGIFLGTYLSRRDTSWKLKLALVPAHRALFNVANCAIACVISGLVYEGVNLTRTTDGGEKATLEVLALTLFTTSYFLINTMGVSYAMSLQARKHWLAVWKENFLWTAPGFYACASVAAGINIAFNAIGPWSLVFLPPIYVIYYSFRLYMDRINKDVAHISELNDLNQAVIASLATAIDAKDRTTSSHINRVKEYAEALADSANVTGPMRQAISTGALVHDIGKLGIPDHILRKPGKLGPDEFRRMQSHVQIGAEILAPVPFKFPVVEVVMSHHERWDGLGYPHRLKGDQIPIGGRIISIVDVFDALTSNRPYRRAMTCEEALAVLREGAGKQFDPNLVDLFLKIMP